MSKLKITPWQIYVSDVIDLTQPIAWKNRENAFNHAKIPLKNDPHWKIWSQGTGGVYSFDKDSDLKPNEQLRFTYMQTIVDVPKDYDLKKFEISFSHVDDGARIYIFNKDHRTGKHNSGVIYGLPQSVQVKTVIGTPQARCRETHQSGRFSIIP